MRAARHRPRSAHVTALLTACAAVCVAAAPGPDAPTPTEYQVKAAMIYNFMRFVEWPSEAFAATDKRINLCTVGADPFEGDLDPLKGKETGGRTIEIRHVESRGDTKGCHVLYVGESEKDRLEDIAKEAAAHNALTVGDSAGFAQKGLAVNFYLEHGTVRFEINLEAARRSKLTISSKFLKLAKIVADAAPPDGGPKKAP
jgi:hypothetical protein